MLSAVIIEDETRYLSAFKTTLQSAYPEVKLKGDAGSIVTARELINRENPDIVFLDIQLADGSAFELLKQLESDHEKRTRPLRIIFTTGHNEFAIKAFRFSAVDYLLKPIVKEELTEAIDKAKMLIQTQGAEKQYKVLLDNVAKPDSDKKICLSTSGEMRICEVSDILRCEAEHNYTTFYFVGQKPLMISKTIKEYEDMLREHGFERIHQSHLVNLKYVKSYLKKEGGFLLMTNGDEVPIARRKKDQVLEKLKHL
jgi:two-component system, LytTR family, response regulator